MEYKPRINLKLIIFLVISAASLLIFYFADSDDKGIYINFFFIPTLLAGYAYDAKGGVITAVVSIIFVGIISFMSFENYMDFITQRVVLWGCFLMVSGYIVGVLNERINNAYLSTIATLALAMESRDPYTYGHSSRVAEVSVRLAKKLKLPKNEQDIIRTAGMLHDIGKFGIREDILRKSGPLTPEEYDHVRQHTLIGVSILSPVRMLRHVIPYIYYHHEHANGMGYMHKRQDEIPLGARILAVADAYDAMKSDRPYRKALSRKAILDVFKNESGRQFDKRVVAALLDMTDSLRADIQPAQTKELEKATKDTQGVMGVV